MTKNNILKYQKSLAKGMTAQVIVTNNSPISIDRFRPIFGNNEANKNDAIAIGKSLNPSKTLAADFAMS
jgi:hypothetical protein